MDQRTRRSPARFLAPLALIAVLIAFLAIVTGSHNGGGSSSPAAGTTTSSTTSSPAKTTTTKTTVKKSKSGATTVRTYTVEVGDTLGSIAAKTGIPLEQIQTLNPDVDPHAMVAGQKIKLK